MEGKRIAKIRHHFQSFLLTTRRSFHDPPSAKSSLVDEGELRPASSTVCDLQKDTSRTTIDDDDSDDVCPKITILPAYSRYLRHNEQRRQILNSAGTSLREIPPSNARQGDRYSQIWQKKSSSFQLDPIKEKGEQPSIQGNSIRRAVTPPATLCRLATEEPSGVGITPATIVCKGNRQSESWPNPPEERSCDGSALPSGTNWSPVRASNSDKEPMALAKSPKKSVSEETVRSFFGFEDDVKASFKLDDFTVRDVSVNDVTDDDTVDKYLNSIRKLNLSGSSDLKAKHPHTGSSVSSRIFASRSLDFGQTVTERRGFHSQRRSWNSEAPSWTSSERSEKISQLAERHLFDSSWSPPECSKTEERVGGTARGGARGGAGGSSSVESSSSSRSLLTSSLYIPYMCDDLSECYRHLAYQTFPFSTGRRSVAERLGAVSEELGVISPSSKATKTVRFAPDVVTKYPSCEGLSSSSVQPVFPKYASVEMSRVLRGLEEVKDRRDGGLELKLNGKQNRATTTTTTTVITSDEKKSTAAVEEKDNGGRDCQVWQLRVPIIRITKADDDEEDEDGEILDATRGSTSLTQVNESLAKGRGHALGNSSSRPVVGLSKRKISEQDLQQVEMFYRSHKTELFVCRCRVTLFFGSVRRHSTVTMTTDPDLAAAELHPESKWTPTKSGILLTVLDSGESRRHRKLYVILAEIGSGFMLWRDCVDHLTSYCNLSSIFHTMHLSHDHTRLAGFLFEDNAAADDFYRKFTSLVSNKNDTLLNLSRATPAARRPQSLPRRSRRRRTSSHLLQSDSETTRVNVSKADISGPCCFTHVTKMDRLNGDIDVDRYLLDSSSSSSLRLDKSPVKCIDVSLLMGRSASSSSSSSSRKFKGRNFRINLIKSSK